MKNKTAYQTIRTIAAVLFIFCCHGQSVSAQDLLILKTGKEIRVNIIEETTDVVKYREYDNPTGPLYSVPKDNIASIQYKKTSRETQSGKLKEPVKAPAVTDASEIRNEDYSVLTAKKRFVLLDGKVQSTRRVKTIMADHPEAIKLYVSGKNLCNASNACALGVLVTSAITSSIVNKKEESAEKIRAGIPGLAIDGGFIIAAIIMSSTGKNKIKKSVAMYNSAAGKPVSYKLNVGFHGNGIGLALTF